LKQTFLANLLKQSGKEQEFLMSILATSSAESKRKARNWLLTNGAYQVIPVRATTLFFFFFNFIFVATV